MPEREDLSAYDVGVAFPGFEHINRFIDRRTGHVMAKILPENSALFAQIMAGGKPLMAFEDDAF